MKGIIYRGDKRLIIEKPKRGSFFPGKYSNVNFLEILGTMRKEYYSHGNKGLRILTEDQAHQMLRSWGVKIDKGEVIA